MNWFSKIQKLLGRFWTSLFSGVDFIRGVEQMHTLAGGSQQAGHDRWAESAVAKSDGMYDQLPFVVYIPTDTIGHPAKDIGDVFNGDCALGDEDAHGGWVADVLYPIPEPAYLADHVLDFTKTLVRGFDYEWRDGRFLFHVDPSTLGFMTVALTDGDGVLRTYYRLFGWRSALEATHDMVTSFYDPKLDALSPFVWDMHQRGATRYNVKQILAGVSGSVVCREDGAIDHVWTEQGYNCMLVGDKVYSAPESTPVGLLPGVGTTLAHGDSVRKGDILFGGLRMYDGTTTPSAAEIPGVHVMTDAGELLASNAETTPYTQDGVRVLPLDGGQGNVEAYKRRCAELTLSGLCPQVDIPSPVNPYLFITNGMRRRNAIVAAMPVGDAALVAAATHAIRDCVNASSMLNLYLYAEGDTVDVPATFTASAGNAALATVATESALQLFAEAEVLP